MKTLLLCGALAAIAVPAAGGELRPAPGVLDAFETTVPAADLDLSRPAGADVLIGRVQYAAQRVCGPDMYRDARQHRRFRRCVATAMNNAFIRLDAPLVTARYLNSVSPARLASN